MSVEDGGRGNKGSPVISSGAGAKVGRGRVT